MTETALQEALHAQVDTVEPDLDRLVAGSTRQGTRIRNVRRGGIALGAVAAVGVIGAVGYGSSLLGGTPTPTEEPGFVAASPSGTTSVPPKVPAPEDGTTLSSKQKGTISARVDRVIRQEAPGVAYSIDPASAVIEFGQTIPARQYRALGDALPGWRIVRFSGGAVGATGLVDEVPVTVTATEWSCSWYLEDDKAACTDADGGVAGLVIRPASEHDEWTSSPDKGAVPGVHVSEVHGDVFITVQGGQGTTNAEIRELGESLRWN